MGKPIKIGNGILEQIKHPYYITGTITKKGLFEYWMQLANSVDEAKELYDIGDIEYDDYDCTDQSEVTGVEEYYEG